MDKKAQVDVYKILKETIPTLEARETQMFFKESLEQIVYFIEDKNNEISALKQELRETYTAIDNSYKSHHPELGLVLCKHCGRIITEHNEDCIVLKAQKHLQEGE